MNLIKKIQATLMPYAFAGALALGTASFVGCASNETMLHRNQTANSPKPKKALKVLELGDDYSKLKYFSEGYVTSNDLDMRITNLAGIYAGTINVRRTENISFEGEKKTTVTKVIASGFYRQSENSEEMKRVLREADANKDKIITKKELEKLEDKIYKEYAK